MKSIKKRISLIAAIVSMTSILSFSSFSANATNYSNGFSRGVRYISYVETDFFWTVDNRYSITSSSATQWEEGAFTWAGGVTRTYTHPLEHYWNCKTSLRIGVGKISYNKTYSDNICLANSGSCWIL